MINAKTGALIVGMSLLSAAGTPQPAAVARVIVATDLHYLAPELRDNGKAFRDFAASGDGRQLADVEAIVDALARDIRRIGPNAVAIGGDLTNNGEKASHLVLARKLRELERVSGTRVFVIPGNHDILNPWARRFAGNKQVPVDSITRNEFRSIYAEFGYAEAISTDSASLSYLAAPSDDLWLLMLDTSEYQYNRALGRPGTRGRLVKDTLEWIRRCVERAKPRGARIVTVMHHNLVDHSELLHTGYTLDNGDEVRDLFDRLGLNVVLSGHLHVQDVERIEGTERPLFDIVTSSLVVYPQQYGVLERLPSGAMGYRTARVDVEGWAREVGARSKQLTGFRTYSESHFIGASYKRTYAALWATRRYSKRESRLMAETMSRLNANYFAGTVGAVRDTVQASEGYRLWTAASVPVFLKRYVLGMMPTTAEDNNHVTIPAPVPSEATPGM